MYTLKRTRNRARHGAQNFEECQCTAIRSEERGRVGTSLWVFRVFEDCTGKEIPVDDLRSYGIREKKDSENESHAVASAFGVW